MWKNIVCRLTRWLQVLLITVVHFRFRVLYEITTGVEHRMREIEENIW